AGPGRGLRAARAGTCNDRAHGWWSRRTDRAALTSPRHYVDINLKVQKHLSVMIGTQRPLTAPETLEEKAHGREGRPAGRNQEGPVHRRKRCDPPIVGAARALLRALAYQPRRHGPEDRNDLRRRRLGMVRPGRVEIDRSRPDMDPFQPRADLW